MGRRGNASLMKMRIRLRGTRKRRKSVAGREKLCIDLRRPPWRASQRSSRTYTRYCSEARLVVVCSQSRYAIEFMKTHDLTLHHPQFRSVNMSFEPICPNITKEECLKARRAESGDLTTPICDCVHFRPLIRPHTDPQLGHCSYLNTCYSEPTYAQSPSIPPLPSHRPPHGYGAQGQAPVALPSGLGAGGRGKEKAPCRYLHFEVDWDGTEAPPNYDGQADKKRPYKLGIGLGPAGRETQIVCSVRHSRLTAAFSALTRSVQLPPQWINCDLRRFDYSVLGKFHVIMADPPWDIHMSVRTPLCQRFAQSYSRACTAAVRDHDRRRDARHADPDATR